MFDPVRARDDHDASVAHDEAPSSIEFEVVADFDAGGDLHVLVNDRSAYFRMPAADAPAGADVGAFESVPLTGFAAVERGYGRR